MEVRTINKRDGAEEDAIRCARGDYTWGSVHENEEPLEELIGHIDPADDILEDRTGMEAKKAHFLKARMNERHWGIWEHPSITLEIEGLSRSAMAQLTRHRHLSFDVMSNRYVDVSDIDPDELFIYPPSFSSDEVVSRDGVRDVEMSAEERKRRADEVFHKCISTYQDFVDAGVPAEDARFLIPMGQATNLRVSGNARAMMHLLNVRLNANVQWEAREGMEGILRECQEWMPITFELFDDMRPIPLAP